MLVHKLFIVCIISLVSVPIISLKAYGEEISNSQHQNAIGVTQNPRQIQNFYTNRQKYLARGVRKIANFYYQKIGKPMPVNSQSMQMVMKILGASSQEENFIREQIIAISNSQANLIRLDATIHRTGNLLRLLER